MIKPDGVSRGKVSEILKRIKQAGLKVIKQKSVMVTRERAADLYSPHLEKPFYHGLMQFITSGPVVACVLEADEAVSCLRQLMGATDPGEAVAGTIRGDLREEDYRTSLGTIKNLVHGSDSVESAKREMSVFFKED
ncbi:MAG: nucleoside-diphosphate kinase [bacterium]